MTRLPSRYKSLGVGKYIGGSVYIHRSYKYLLPQQELKVAEFNVPSRLGGQKYTLIKYNLNTGAFTFIWCNDFDSADEPTMGIAIIATPNDLKCSSYTLRVLQPPNDPWIYHHKWLMVTDDYLGFDVDQSRARSEKWMLIQNINKSLIGKKSYWETYVLPQLLP